MLCPNCGSATKAQVKETRAAADGGIRRRRRCAECHADFTTLEHVSGERLRIRKSDGREELFDRAKLRKGIVKAAVRPHHIDRLAEVVEAIAQSAYEQASDETLDSQVLAVIVLDHLREFDEVTHVRFALTQLGRRDQAGSGWSRASDFRRWLTKAYPRLEHSRPQAKLSSVVKRDGRREPYDRRKLERSIGVASKGRGGSDDVVRDLASSVAEEVEQALSDQVLVTSGQIAAEIVRTLRRRDHIAAIRYSSTSKRFSSVEDYEIEALGLRGPQI